MSIVCNNIEVDEQDTDELILIKVNNLWTRLKDTKWMGIMMDNNKDIVNTTEE